jgi:hypothetical protein
VKDLNVHLMVLKHIEKKCAENRCTHYPLTLREMAIEIPLLKNYTKAKRVLKYLREVGAIDRTPVIRCRTRTYAYRVLDYW